MGHHQGAIYHVTERYYCYSLVIQQTPSFNWHAPEERYYCFGLVLHVLKNVGNPWITFFFVSL